MTDLIESQFVKRRPLDRRGDPRGWFQKILMRHHLGAEAEFGEIYVTSAVPGEARGNHFHRRTNEWFCLLEGRARLALMDPDSGEREDIVLDAEEPEVVEIPAGVAHAVQNIGEGLMLLLAYADIAYDAADPDEVRLAVV